ncbi:Vacuolar protein sorting-associated protein 17, partial [Massospora cicadina]
MPHFEVLPSTMDHQATLPVDLEPGLEDLDLSEKEVVPLKDETFLKIAVISHDYSGAASYRLSVETNMSQYKDKELVDKDRAYTEFISLHEQLQKGYPDIFVPVLPPLLVNDSVDPIKDNYDFRRNPLAGGPTFTDPVRHDIQIFLDRVTAHPILRKDGELQHFLLSSFKYIPPPPHAQANTPSYPAATEDRFNGRTRIKCQTYVTRIQELILTYCNFNRQRRDLASRLAALASKLQALGPGDDNPQVLKALRRSASAVRTNSSSLRHGADIDGSVMTLRYIESLGRQVQLAQSRFAHASWVESELKLAKKRVETTRYSLVILKAAPVLRPDRVSAALEDFEEAKKQLSFREGQSERRNRRMPDEMQRFERECNFDTRVNFIRHVRYQLALERHTLHAYKEALAEVKKLKGNPQPTPPPSDAAQSGTPQLKASEAPPPAL